MEDLKEWEICRSCHRNDLHIRMEIPCIKYAGAIHARLGTLE
jgi:hypothetical protein